MPGGDPASSPRASTRHTPADDADSLEDLLAEPLLLARLAAPRTDRTGAVITGPHGIAYDPLPRARVTALVQQQIASAGLDEAQEYTEMTRERVRQLIAEQTGTPARIAATEESFDLLDLMSYDENPTVGMRAACIRRLFGKEPRSLDEIADQYGMCRATAGNVYRVMQKHFEDIGLLLKSRADKSDTAREACRQRRLGKRKKRQPWLYADLCRNPIPIPLPC